MGQEETITAKERFEEADDEDIRELDAALRNRREGIAHVTSIDVVEREMTKTIEVTFELLHGDEQFTQEFSLLSRGHKHIDVLFDHANLEPGVDSAADLLGTEFPVRDTLRGWKVNTSEIDDGTSVPTRKSKVFGHVGEAGGLISFMSLGVLLMLMSAFAAPLPLTVPVGLITVYTVLWLGGAFVHAKAAASGHIESEAGEELRSVLEKNGNTGKTAFHTLTSGAFLRSGSD